jgi:hypothetical protein
MRIFLHRTTQRFPVYLTATCIAFLSLCLLGCENNRLLDRTFGSYDESKEGSPRIKDALNEVHIAKGKYAEAIFNALGRYVKISQNNDEIIDSSLASANPELVMYRDAAYAYYKITENINNVEDLSKTTTEGIKKAAREYVIKWIMDYKLNGKVVRPEGELMNDGKTLYQ